MLLILALTVPVLLVLSNITGDSGSSTSTPTSSSPDEAVTWTNVAGRLLAELHADPTINFAQLTPAELATHEPRLTWVGPDSVSTDPQTVSVGIDGTKGFTLAVATNNGRCLFTDADPLNQQPRAGFGGGPCRAGAVSSSTASP